MQHERDTKESSENAEVSDSAYYNSSSNSRSRSSRSSKSTASKSLSSRSSGYGGAHKDTGSSSQGNRLTNKSHPEIRSIEKKKTTGTINAEKVAKTKTTNKTNDETMVEKGEIDETRLPSQTSNIQQQPGKTETPVPESTTNITDGTFSCVISINDGVVISTTASLTKSLGFPIEMWVGRSFTDFVHPSDQESFTLQLTNALEEPKKEADVIAEESENSAVAGNPCRVRKFRCLSSGFSIKNKAMEYLPFYLDLSKKKVTDEKETVNCLVIQAKQIFSAYKEKNEPVTNAVAFTMRHSASGFLQYIDKVSIPYLGYIPQDIVNNDIFELYHCDDLVYIKQVYELIVKDGRMPRSKSYRLLAQNGGYVKVETEWSSFVNPWSKKLEFVTGKHYVVEGPVNPDVFQAAPVQNNSIWYETEQHHHARSLRAQIVCILTEEPPVMLGGVSPHYDNSDSKSSTDTQSSSYTYLNYSENLDRYFSSQAPFADEMFNAVESSYIDNEREKNSSRALTYSGDLSDSGCMFFPLPPLPLDAAPSARLTEMVLFNHNKSMQKDMIKIHSEMRVTHRRKKKFSSYRQKRKDHMARCNSAYQRTISETSELNQEQLHGVKRVLSVSSQATDSQAKHQCFTTLNSTRPYTTATATTATFTLTRTLSNEMISRKLPNQADKTESQIQLIRAGIQPATPCALGATTCPDNSMNLKAVIIGIGVPQDPIGALSVRCVVLGPNLGPLVMNPVVIQSPENLRLPTEVASELLTRKNQSTAHLELDDRNYDEACKYVSPIDIEKQDNRKNVIFPKILESRNRLHSTNALNRSNEAVPEWQLLRGVHQRSSDDNPTSDNATNRTDGGSSYSSFYSTFLRTDSGNNTDSSDRVELNSGDQLKQNPKMAPNNKFMGRKVGAPWTENVNMTPDIIYKYEVIPKSVEETLENDKNMLVHLEQPLLVNDQLEQLYFELQLEGAAARLHLEEGSSSSDASSAEEGSSTASVKVYRKRDYSNYGFIHEGYAPLPPPPEEDDTLVVPIATSATHN